MQTTLFPIWNKRLPVWLNVLWSLLKLAIIGVLIFLGSCSTTRTILKQAPTDVPLGWQASPRSALSDETVRARLQAEIYGRLDIEPKADLIALETVQGHEMSDRVDMRQWRLSVSYGAAARPLDLVLLTPKDRPNAPIILSQNFCPNDDVVRLSGIRTPENSGFDCSGGGFFGAIMNNVFGRYIVSPPLEDIVSRGYGFAAIYPSQFVPDSARSGRDALDELFPNDPNRPGALAVWASLFGLSASLIEVEIGERPIIAYGHSRFGKTALLAAAWSDHIDAAIAHQSGTLGASSLTDRDGEPLSALLDAYPHWVGSGLAAYADAPASLSVRPADLLALTGDKPVLLGNARRDVWSDPWGAFTEAKAAWGDRFSTPKPAVFKPDDQKAYWLRPGTHGVVEEDWPAFLTFLDAHFSP